MGGKTEPEDYVTCLECGHRAENLTSHTQSSHPGYRESHPEAFLVALRSSVRDKSALKGLKRPPEFGQKIAEAKRLGLVRGDFEPFLGSDGRVDHRAMMKSVGCAWPTLKRYMDSLGLTATRKYIEAASAERRVTLTVEDLEPFKLKNGKVSIALAMPVLGFTNPPTGHRFRFDALFPDVGLIVEFQGHQHYTFPNAFMPDESYLPEYEALRERDRIKREMIEAAPDLIYFEVLEEEPYDNPSYLHGRLVQLGVLSRSRPTDPPIASAQ